jgi:hypothetical protein
MYDEHLSFRHGLHIRRGTASPATLERIRRELRRFGGALVGTRTVASSCRARAIGCDNAVGARMPDVLLCFDKNSYACDGLLVDQGPNDGGDPSHEAKVQWDNDRAHATVETSCE